MPVGDSARIRAQALEVAAGWSGPQAPGSWRLTAALFEAIAADDGLLADLAALPDDRLPALLASAAIAALARVSEHPVARYFPEPGRGQPPFDDGFAAAAANFIAGRQPAIMALCQRRRYQMTEVARCVQLALGVAAVADPADGPVAHVDLGTGAGFGLRLDRYAYEMGDRACARGGAQPGREVAGAGSAAAALRLPVEWRGEHAPPRPVLPPVAARAGIEINPVDLHDPAASDWLIACAPPEAATLTRLAAAIEVARAYPVPVFPGDAVDALPEVLASLPPGMPVIVTDSYLAVFLPPGLAIPASGNPGRRGERPPGDLAVTRPAGAARVRRQRQRPGCARAGLAGRGVSAVRRVRGTRGADIRAGRIGAAARARAPVRAVDTMAGAWPVMVRGCDGSLPGQAGSCGG